MWEINWLAVSAVIVGLWMFGVIWWGDPKKWIVQKILIMVSHRLVSLVAAGYILSIW